MMSALMPMATTLICKLKVRAYRSPIRPRRNPPTGRAKNATAKTPYTSRSSSSLPPVKNALLISVENDAKTPKSYLFPNGEGKEMMKEQMMKGMSC